MPRPIDGAEYTAKFGSTEDGPDLRKDALEHALDNRKFEIDLYWTRATYFWTFIAAAFGAYGLLQAMPDQAARTDLSVVLGCVGLVLSFSWYCANRGSKQWQENWENHVDLLEDSVVGPLYKIVLRRPQPRGVRQYVADMLTGPAPFSVSKINQLVSLYITVVWLGLIVYALPPIRFGSPVNLLYGASIVLALATCIIIVALGRTHGIDYSNVATIRESAIQGLPTDS